LKKSASADNFGPRAIWYYPTVSTKVKCAKAQNKKRVGTCIDGVVGEEAQEGQ